MNGCEKSNKWPATTYSTVRDLLNPIVSNNSTEHDRLVFSVLRHIQQSYQVHRHLPHHFQPHMLTLQLFNPGLWQLHLYFSLSYHNLTVWRWRCWSQLSHQIDHHVQQASSPCFSVSTNPRYHCWSSTTTKCHPEISCSNKKSQCPLQIPLHPNSHLIFPNT